MQYCLKVVKQQQEFYPLPEGKRSPLTQNCTPDSVSEVLPSRHDDYGNKNKKDRATTAQMPWRKL
jgi:hypothetical protein